MVLPMSESFSPALPLPRWHLPRLTLRAETLALGFGLFFALAGNRMFWTAALQGRDPARLHDLLLIAALFVLLTVVHFVLLTPFALRRVFRPLFGLLCLATACATYCIDKFGVYLDPGMLRNVLRTDFPEARELFAPDMLPYLFFYAFLPTVFLARVELRSEPFVRALLRRLALMLAACLVSGALLLLAFQDFAALMRGQKELRYWITPANSLYSLARVVSSDARASVRPRLPVGADARLGTGWRQRRKPVLMVIVVGETARAANWGLSGYRRQTTPQLAALGVLNFAETTSCGTNTEVSVPCMFSAVGRRDYDEERIRGSESLLHVLDHAGIQVTWRDNQSGCKGVCDGLVQERPAPADHPALCADGRCLDEALLEGLDRWLADRQGNQVLVLHTLGNHGPAYYQRHPAAFRRFTPTCDSADLGRCTAEQIVNSYDNALLYTDHVLARAVAFLKRHADSHDTALLYASDHGESLGENGLFLHGMPYAIAPEVQKQVPMAMWLSEGYAASFGVDAACLAERARRPASHDHLFHTVLGMLDIRTEAYARDLDLLQGCRG